MQAPRLLRRKTPDRALAPAAAAALPPGETPPDQGLTEAQAAERMAAGLDNCAVDPPTKTEGRIVREHLLTFFNFVFVVLAVCLALVGSWRNATFLIVVVCNTAIGMVQELRSRRTVDRLTLMARRKVRCVRGGKVKELPAEALVRDDIVEFAAGDQICADAVLRTGSVQANEALVTGEADPVAKLPGDPLRSGSFVVSGRCRAQLTQVGAASFANSLTVEARRHRRVEKGEMMRSLDRLIRFIGLAIGPLGVLLFLRQYRGLELGLRDSVVSTVAALIGMIPEGLYLLTSVALAVSMVRLARRKVMARQLSCIETLARVDVLCVDKTGTITEPKMSVGEIVPLSPDTWPPERLEEALRAFYGEAEPENDTARALAERFGGGAAGWQRTAAVPFDPARKWSAAAFGAHGAFVAGAPEFVLGGRYAALAGQVEPYLAQGYRVLLFAACPDLPDPAAGPGAVQPLALLLLTNPVRPQAAETFAYFETQGVAVKVLSGDHPRAVSEAARRAGIAGAGRCVDATTLCTDEAINRAAGEYTVFGRVTPDQKRKLIRAMRAQGHTVAMTGDGVNDVLALKDADCGIAMASGAQAAAQVAQLVLLDSDFSGLPAVVAEGRRVINNIERSAALYLVKNLFSFLLTVILLFVALPYPLQPIQLTLISAITIGIPSFFLALEPNHELVRGRFLANVLRAALPGALTNLGLILGVEAFVCAFDLPVETLYTISTLVVLTVNLLVLFYVCRPFTVPHGILWGGMLVLACCAVAALGPLFSLVRLDLQGALVLAVFLLLALPLLRLMRGLPGWVGRLAARLNPKPKKSEPQTSEPQKSEEERKNG